MKHLITDHSWKTIGDKNELSKLNIESKIKSITTMYALIEQSEGTEVATNTFDLIIHCLNRCNDLVSLVDSQSVNDYYVFFGYASIKSEEAQLIINQHFSHMDL